MRRKQLYLDEATARALTRLAARTGRSETSHVREALQWYLGMEVERGDDPLERLIGLVPDAEGPNDVAEHHDCYVYKASREHR